jgi:hypothetical protein
MISDGHSLLLDSVAKQKLGFLVRSPCKRPLITRLRAAKFVNRSMSLATGG